MIKIIKWKNIYFYVTRMNVKYTYPYIINFNSTNKKLCGYDSEGTELNFPNDVVCPINNFIINHSPIPLSEEEEYEWVTKQINNNIYIHYTNKYFDGKILVNFKIIDYYNDIKYIYN